MGFLGGNLGCGLFGLRIVDEVENLFIGRIDRSDGRKLVVLAFVGALLFFGLLVILGFRSGDRELAPHEELVVENLDGALRFVDVDHLNEAVAFRAVSGAVVDDLHVTNGSDSLEQFLEIALGGVVGEVADIDAAVLNGGRIASAWAAGIAFLALAAAWGFASFGGIRLLGA